MCRSRWKKRNDKMNRNERNKTTDTLEQKPTNWMLRKTLCEELCFRNSLLLLFCVFLYCESNELVKVIDSIVIDDIWCSLRFYLINFDSSENVARCKKNSRARACARLQSSRMLLLFLTREKQHQQQQQPKTRIEIDSIRYTIQSWPSNNELFSLCNGHFAL